MKKFSSALLAVCLLASLFLSLAPVTAAAAASCGSTYTVESGDYLNKIAGACNTSVGTILELNPQITDVNVIFVGQILRLTGQATFTSVGSTIPIETNTGVARVSISGTRASAGDVVTVYVSGFPANADIDYRVGPRGTDPSAIYDGAVNANGMGDMSVTIPADADVGENWVVEVVTTSEVTVVSVTSNAIYIGAYNPTSTTTNTGNARVSLSATQAVVGDQIIVYVSDFPANADVDFRVGPTASTYSQVYDSKVNSLGNTSQTISIPTDAVPGEYWVVQVITTSEVQIVKASSALILIGSSSSSSTYSSTARVSLSSTKAAAGDVVTVSVTGFPSNADVDFRVGKQFENFVVAYDTKTDSDGAASQAITIPSDASSGELWVVKVITTELNQVTSVTSRTISVP